MTTETTEAEATETIEALPDLDPAEMTEKDIELAKSLGLMDEDGNIIEQPLPEAVEAQSIRQIYSQFVQLVAAAGGKATPRLNEANATKLLELSLFWAVNSRNGGLPPIIEDK